MIQVATYAILGKDTRNERNEEFLKPSTLSTADALYELVKVLRKEGFMHSHNKEVLEIEYPGDNVNHVISFRGEADEIDLLTVCAYRWMASRTTNVKFEL